MAPFGDCVSAAINCARCPTRRARASPGTPPRAERGRGVWAVDDRTKRRGERGL